MRYYKAQIQACDFFTIETLFLQTVYVLFFIELQTRRVYIAGCTTHPDGPWVNQQARQMVWELEERPQAIHFLIHDRDNKFVTGFDTVFQSTGAHVIHTPFRAPNANAYAERSVRSVGRKCLNKLIILNQAHLRQVLNKYLTYYNGCRPHQGLDQHTPLPLQPMPSKDQVHSRAILGGIIHDHCRAA